MPFELGVDGFKLTDDWLAPMPVKPEFLPKTIQPRVVLFAAFPEVGLLDLTGPQTVFWAATKAMEKRGRMGYLRHTVSLEGGLIKTGEGMEVQTSPAADFAKMPVDTLVVPGSPFMERLFDQMPDLVDWLRMTSARARRTVSVCSGTFLLAQAGLLEGRRAATHWGMCDNLRSCFPSVVVDQDAIFIQHDEIWTSAGVSAGIDLALALVEEDCGREVAMEVAREMVVFLKRPGGQSQFSELLQAQGQDHAAFDELHLWITSHLDETDLSVEALAARVGMSPRNFARVYKDKTGRTPAKAIELFRLEVARRLLEDSERNVDQIARQCGFGDEERMRVTFQRHLKVAPRDYRKRFSR